MLNNDDIEVKNGTYSWNSWAVWIVKTLKETKELSQKTHDEIITLKTKVAVIGGVSGIVGAALATAIINVLMNH